MAISTANGTAPWAMVLAGEGNGVRPGTRGWLGHDRSKQSCSFAGGRCAGSMLVPPMTAASWSGSREPERGTSTLTRMGKQPALPTTVATGRGHGLPRALSQARRTITP